VERTDAEALNEQGREVVVAVLLRMDEAKLAAMRVPAQPDDRPDAA
jgi:hypothetical protein